MNLWIRKKHPEDMKFLLLKDTAASLNKRNFISTYSCTACWIYRLGRNILRTSSLHTYYILPGVSMHVRPLLCGLSFFAASEKLKGSVEIEELLLNNHSLYSRAKSYIHDIEEQNILTHVNPEYARHWFSGWSKGIRIKQQVLSIYKRK